MIKGLLLLFNLPGIFFPGTVSLTQTSPATAEINNSVLVQISINKGDVSGPASFSEHLPAGLRATAIDDESAHTSFDSNTIVFSWSSLPADGNLNISFRIDVTSLATVQNDVLNGKFIYTSNSSLAEADCSSNISIIGTQGTTSQNAMPQADNATQSSNSQQNAGGASVERQFSSLSIAPNTSATVTLIIHKPMGGGFARIEDSIPPGFTANKITTAGASFTFIDNTAKFVWQNIPSDSVIKISYLLTASGSAMGNHVINGDFSYIYNQSPLSITTVNTAFNVSSSATNVSVVPPTSAVTPHTDNIPKAPVHVDNKPLASANKPLKTETPAAIPVAPKADRKSPKKDVIAPSKGVTYRVQIIALQKPVNLSSLLTRKNIKEHVTTESGGGFTKYTIGNYSSFQSAEEVKNNMIRKGFYGAFVVCYKAGSRVTLQEALSGN